MARQMKKVRKGDVRRGEKVKKIGGGGLLEQGPTRNEILQTKKKWGVHEWGSKLMEWTKYKRDSSGRGLKENRGGTGNEWAFTNKKKKVTRELKGLV